MIAANEIRVGNLILNDGVVVKSDGRTIFDIWGENKVYLPIELTEEWLLKFGFESELTGVHKEQWQLYKKDHFVLHWRNEFCEFGWIESIEIKYVHQLQNLFYALTGEELIIKP